MSAAQYPNLTSLAAQAHQSVLLSEAVQALVHDAAGYYIDATFGYGGHSQLILQSLNKDGRLLALDRDPEAIIAGQALMAADSRFQIIQTPFAQLLTIARQQQLVNRVQGILLDIGVSSPQLDNAARGFSFMRTGPLDMRMDPSRGISAAQWLAKASEQEISEVLFHYGEERFARRLAKAIVAARAIEPLSTTTQLAEILKKAHPAWEKHHHPATRAFQAIRIYINDELNELMQALNAALAILAPGGHLVVISFHSLEDRIVKRFLRDHTRIDQAIPQRLPIETAHLRPQMALIGKAQRPSMAEIDRNPRARSAIMRVARKC